ncbi:unnamed protein product [Ilex paraguariensis]|uniref:BRCT domain-containing protein n=1 Tax=Ilex paraguariensis TaxID=185542 RepID=A0ABC8T6L4_9AQUA
MGSLIGFRPPQFSEDLAWLPAWLQPNHDQPLNQHNGEGHTPMEQCIQELSNLQQNISTEDEANLSSRDEAGRKSFPLFLSGEDNSPVSFAQSSGNMVHFHLHLSLDGNSEYENAPSPLLDTSQAEICKLYHPMQPTEASNIPDEKNKFEVHHNAGVVNFPFSTPQHEKPKNSCSQSLTDYKDKLEKHNENVNSPSKVADISNAVELSIAASEALVIYELITFGTFTQFLPASAVLEVALKLKQARLEGLEETSYCLTEELSEIDFLSDLDELTMADAYEDVGLFATGRDGLHGHDSIVSQVKDTFASEIYTSENKSIHEEVGVPEFDYGHIHRKELLEDVLDIDIQLKKELALEAFQSDGQKKLIDDPPLGLNATSVSCHLDPMLHCPVQENPQISASIEKPDFSMGDKALFQAIANSPLRARSSENAERETQPSNIVPDRFQSRWLGGWIWKKEVADSAPVESNNAQSIPAVFVSETSFFSESADLVPDENSVVQKQDKGSNIASQASIPFEGLCNKANEGILPSQDVARSSSLSFDPLCSVVPCSISLQNTCSVPASKPNVKVDSGKYFSTAQEYGMDNSHMASALNLELVDEEVLAVPVTSGVVRRKFASLKTYSMYPVADLIKEMRNFDEIAADETKFPANRQKERNSPVVLNRGTRCRFQACFAHSVDEGNAEAAIEPEGEVELLQRKNLQKAESKCKNLQDIRVPARKRVHFSEAEIHIPQQKKLHKLQSAYRNCSSNRVPKRLRCPNLHFESRPCEVKRRGGNYRDKDGKRMIFQNIEFLLTGFSSLKEKEIERLIKKYGGILLTDIPSPNSRAKRSSKFDCQPLPVILCLKKVQTTKFLYGCAVNACILKVNWLTDSIAVGYLLAPEKYMILPNHVGGKCTRIGKPLHRDNHQYVFDSVGIMLHGTHNFCTKMARVVRHGGGQVFKTLQWLVQSLDAEKISMGYIVAEDESRASRHLKHCALEQKIPMMPASWIIKNLHAGKLLPFMENDHSSRSSPSWPLDFPVSMDWSEEI